MPELAQKEIHQSSRACARMSATGNHCPAISHQSLTISYQLSVMHQDIVP
jgi:hypothetical protein